MPNLAYAEKLRDPRWQKKRLEILERDRFTCLLCGDEKTTLNVHHSKYIKGAEPWDIDNCFLKTLCEHCHELLTNHIKEGGDPNCFEVLKVNENGGIYCYVLTENGMTRYSMNKDDPEFKIHTYTLKKILHFIINSWLKVQ